jgi:alpha-L-fucosidase
MYVHVVNKPGQPYLFIPQLTGKVTKANLLADGSVVKFKQQPEGVFIYLDNIATDPNDTIIKLTTN